MILRALSIRQPWAWLIVQGFKDIENRTWGTAYRGPLYIHAGKVDDYEACQLFVRSFDVELAKRIPPREELLRGGIVGRVELHHMLNPWSKNGSDWYVGDFGWCLTNPEPLPFVACSGRQGLFNLPDAIAVQLRGAA